MGTNIEVSGYQPRLLAIRSSSHSLSLQKNRSYLNKVFRLSVFWIFTFLGMTVPYRIFFKRHCDFVRVTLVKETYKTTTGSRANGYLRSWFPTYESKTIKLKPK